MRSVALLVVLASTLLASEAAALRVDRQSLSTLTNLVTIALSQHERLDVISSADVREVVALEAEKQSMGCEDDSSCLAEVAGAMGARFVVFGHLGGLGSLHVLTLNLFDSEAAQAVGREVIKADSLEGLADKLDLAVARLVSPVVDKGDAEARYKALVLDLKPASGVMPPESVEEPETTVSAKASMGGETLLLLAGGALGGLGVLVAVLGGGAVIAAGAEAERAQSADFHDVAFEAKQRSDALVIASDVAFVGAAALVLAGAGVAALALLSEDTE